jgi:large subunit ribosomal protein L13
VKKTTYLTTEKARKAKKWYLLDAKGKTLGRFAAEIAKILTGKHRVVYTPHVDSGEGVIVINASKIRVSGSKASRKIYRSYTGWMGGMNEIPYQTMIQNKPEEVIWRAVSGMVPKSRLGRQQMGSLRIFADDKHGMEAQQPIGVNI